jgi:phosphomannomutase/phosphoglucomutase
MVQKAETEEIQVIDTSQPRQKKKKSAGPKVGGLFRHVAITAIAVLVAMVIGMVAMNLLVVDAEAKRQGERLAKLYAQQYAAFYNQVFGRASRQISGIISDPSLIELLASGDDAAIQQRAASIAAAMTHSSQVFMVSGQSTLPSIPLGFAAQEMLERAQRGESTTAEVIPIAERPLLLLAATVRDGAGTIVGALLVAFDLNDIAADMKSFDVTAGQMTLRQQFTPDEEAVVVMTHGQEAAGATQQVVLPTLHPNLTVGFALKPDISASSGYGMFILIGAGTSLLVLIAVVLSTLLLRRTLQRNTSMLMLCAENLIQRTPVPVGIIFTLDIFEEAAATLRRTARNTGSEAVVQGQTGTQSAARRDDALAVAEAPAPARPPAPDMPAEIFRAYDIRGVVGKTLTEDIVRLIGKAIGSEALDNQQKAVHVGRDGRLSGPQLLGALIEGITSTGCNVVNVGMVPTPLLYFATANTATKSGVMLTGSHNPPDYNGLKIVINGDALSGERILALRQRIIDGNLHSGSGSVETLDIGNAYRDRVRDDIVLARSMKIVVDCGNGIAGAVAPQLLESLGCTVIPLYCDVDGHFPNHHPDPSNPDNLNDLISRVLAEKADLGLAFDGDGDRLGVVTPEGKIIWPDRLMMLYARDILMRTPGADIIFDVKCTRDLAAVISQHGGRPIMWRTGHSLIKAKLKETKAALAGEMSGHIFFNDRWPGFDDAIYAAARLLEILSLEVASADEVFAEFPANVSTPELHINVTEDSKFRIIETLQKNAQFSGGSISTIDGLRVDFPGGWGLVRASNTTPVLVARFEGKTQEELEAVRSAFREQLLKAEPGLRITF